jgi:Ca2+-dependent lipid-binding protein
VRSLFCVIPCRDELTAGTESGVVVFNVLEGHLYKKARLEVLLDDGYWPAFSTIKARSTHAQWETVGEGFLKELDFGRVWLRLNEADEGDKDDVVCEWKGDAKQFLQQTMVRLPAEMLFLRETHAEFLFSWYRAGRQHSR